MEPVFDKEIDALLRKETAGRTITISEFGGIHLDADEITAFAEKRVPPGVRGIFIEHFAACDRCRTILLNAAWLNAEEVPEIESAIAAPVGADLPWYRRHFLFPNLAYVMGGMIVLFAGFIGLTVYTGLTRDAAIISMSNTAEPAPASAPVRPAQLENMNATANITAAGNSINSVSNTMSNAAANIDAAKRHDQTATEPTPEPRATAVPDADDLARPRQPAMAAPPPKSEPYVADGVVTQRKIDDPALASGSAAKEKESREESKKMAESPASPAGRTLKMSPAPKSRRPDAQNSDSDSRSRNAEKDVTDRRKVQGRTFEFRQGAWYDLTYRGQSITAVQRKSAEYYKLDVGLRGIAESFVGTVVTVWNGKAYRIH